MERQIKSNEKIIQNLKSIRSVAFKVKRLFTEIEYYLYFGHWKEIKTSYKIPTRTMKIKILQF